MEEKTSVRLLGLFVLIILLVNISIQAEETATNSNPNEFTFGDTKIEKSNEVKHSDEGEDSKKIHMFDLKDGGSITVNYRGKETRTYSGFKTGEPTKFLFDMKGKLTEAEFTAGGDSSYKLGNKEFKIKAGDKVVYKDGKATITRKGGKIEKPTILSGLDDENIILEYQSSEHFILEDGESFNGILKYEDNGGFFIDSDGTIGAIEIKNPSKVKTYLRYDGEIHPELKAAYISMDKSKGKFTLGCNIDMKGPVIRFKEGTYFGMKIEKEDNFAMQALGNTQGSYISIQDRTKENKVPIVKTLNQYAINYDNKGVYYNSNTQKIYVRAKGVVIEDFGKSFEGKSSSPIEIHNFKTVGGKEVSVSKYNNILGVSNLAGIGYGSNPGFIRTHLLSYYNKIKSPTLFTGFSNSLSYNYDLTERGFEKFTGLKLSLDSYSQGVMTKERYLMLMDWAAQLGENARRSVKSISLVRDAGDGAIALGGPGGIKMGVGQGALVPSILTHEATHAVNIGNNAFWNDWERMGGNRDTEEPSEFSEFMFRDITNSLKTKALTRGRVAVLTKYGVISQERFDYMFGRAGLKTGKETVNYYLSNRGAV